MKELEQESYGLLVNSKTYVNEAGITFLSPANLLKPITSFVDERGDNVETITNVAHPIINVNDDGTENTAYARGLITANIKSPYKDYEMTYGLLYALDIQKPVIKIFSGATVKACTNLSLFDADNVHEYHLLESNAIKNSENAFNLLISQEEARLNKIEQMFELLSSTSMTHSAVERALGFMLKRAMRKSGKLPLNIVTSATKALMDKNSVYNFKDTTTAYNFYQAFTAQINRNKELLFTTDKTLMIEDAITDLFQLSYN